MRIHTVIFLIGLLVARGAHAGDPWDKTEIVLGSAAAALTVIDWGQTRWMAKNFKEWGGRETNVMLGAYPSVGNVNNYFAVSLMGGALLAEVLPSPYRKMFLGGALLLELKVTSKNKSLKVGFTF